MKKFLPALAANLSAALSEILLLAASAWLIATAALKPPLSALSVGITLVRAAGISRAALRYGDRFLSHRIIFRLLDELREKLFRRAAAQLPLKSGRSSEGALLHELTVTADLLKDFLPRVVLPLATAALVTALLTVFLWRALGIFALILPAIFLAVGFLSWKVRFGEADDSEYRAKILDFHGVDELKIFGTAPALKKLDAAAEKFGATQAEISTRQVKFDALIKILSAAGICAILLELSAAVGKVELTVWALILLAVLEILASIPAAVRTYKKIRGAETPAVENKIAQDVATDFAVEMRSVNFGYDAAQPVIKNFSLQIKRGERWAILGESGAGKTTLVYIMTKLFAPDNGTVAVSGTVAAATSTNYIFSDSVRGNFEIYGCEMAEALEICQLEDFDVNAVLGEDGAEISGGEKVRLQTALALAKNPDVLILDEPTAGLDKIRAEKLVDAVIDDSAKKNRTLIVITHDLSVAQKFENAVELL